MQFFLNAETGDILQLRAIAFELFHDIFVHVSTLLIFRQIIPYLMF